MRLLTFSTFHTKEKTTTKATLDALNFCVNNDMTLRKSSARYLPTRQCEVRLSDDQYQKLLRLSVACCLPMGDTANAVIAAYNSQSMQARATHRPEIKYKEESC